MRITILTFIIMITFIGCGDYSGNLSNLFMNKMTFEELVDRFENEDRAAWQKPDEVIDLFGNIKGKTIMDIGAGTGYFSFRMSAKGAKVIAADVDDRFLNYIKEKKEKTDDRKITIRKTEYDDPLLKKNEVHHVIIVNTYHHIDDRSEYFSKVANGIKPGGSLMIVDFKKSNTTHGPPKRHRVAAEKAVEELKKAGFKSFKINNELLENQYILTAQK